MNPTIIFGTIGVVANIALTAFFYGRLTQATTTNTNDLKEIKLTNAKQWDKLDEHGNRITSLEAWKKTLPGCDNFSPIRGGHPATHGG